MARECVSNRAPVAWLETDHGSNVNIAEHDGEAAYHGTVLGGLNPLAARASAYAIPRPWRGSRAKDGKPMNRCLRNPIAEILWFCIVSVLALAQLPEPLPKLSYTIIPDFFQLPPEEHFIEPAGVAVNSKGHIYVFHRGKHPLMEFDSSGKFLRSIADDLFVMAHMVRVDPEDNIWTTDIGAHVVLKLNPEGHVLLALGR